MMKGLDACYAMIGGNEKDVIARFGGNEALLVRFLLKFREDESFSRLEKALSRKDQKTAFLAAHTLKGICANLGFTNLYLASSRITEHLRHGDIARAQAEFPSLKEGYRALISALDA